jgi:hypothetical protein
MRLCSGAASCENKNMSRYPDEMSLQDARKLFFKRSNLGEDGGYSSRWVRVESKPFPFYFPNSRSRVAAARLHDLHHIAAEYETDWPGEAEISAWEIASGCAAYHAAWILDLGGLYAGIVVAPRRLFRAFLRGRRAATNLYKNGFDESRLSEITVGTLRGELGLQAPIRTARAADIGLFVLWCALSVLVWAVLPLLALILIWLVARRAI